MATKYLVCSFFFEEGELPNEFYIVDRNEKKVLMYQFYHDCKDNTKYLQRMWEKDKDLPYGEARIGRQLIDVLNGDEPKGSLKMILATDDARKVTNKVCEFRAKWFSIRQRRLEYLATSESAGWSEGADDSFVAVHFCEL